MMIDMIYRAALYECTSISVFISLCSVLLDVCKHNHHYCNCSYLVFKPLSIIFLCIIILQTFNITSTTFLRDQAHKKHIFFTAKNIDALLTWSLLWGPSHKFQCLNFPTTDVSSYMWLIYILLKLMQPEVRFKHSFTHKVTVISYINKPLFILWIWYWWAIADHPCFPPVATLVA